MTLTELLPAVQQLPFAENREPVRILAEEVDGGDDIAALTLGNAKSVDILVRTASGRKWEVSVKAARGGGKWGVGSEPLAERNDLIFVFLHYARFNDVTSRPDVFVVPAPDVERLKGEWFDSYAVYFANQECRERLTQFRDAWHWFA